MSKKGTVEQKMKNKAEVLFIILSLVSLFAYSETKKTRLIDIVDSDLCFDDQYFYREYDISTNLDYLDIGYEFQTPIFESEIDTGSLEVEFILSNGERNKFFLSSVYKIIYCDFGKKLVKKVYFSPIEIQDEPFVNKIIVSIENPFYFKEKVNLIITNRNSRMFFD